MKQRIALKDVLSLSQEQRQNLLNLWTPEIYDVVVALICTDVSAEKYNAVEFVIGGLEIYHGTCMILHDIRSLESPFAEDKAITPEQEESVTSQDLESSSSQQNINNAASVQVDDFTFTDSTRLSSAYENLIEPFIDHDEEYLEGENEESDCFVDEEFDYSHPTSFNKETCLPLLGIGQMIDILARNGFGKGDFYIFAVTNEICCELGKESINYNSYGIEYDRRELCDVLWESVKALL